MAKNFTATVLWVYDVQCFPAPAMDHLKQNLRTNIIPARTTQDALNVLNYSSGLVTHLVTCYERYEYGRMVMDAGLRLVHAVRQTQPYLPIAVFSQSVVADQQKANVCLQVGLGPVGVDGRTAVQRGVGFEIVADGITLTSFLSHTIPLRKPQALNSQPHLRPNDVIVPYEGQHVTSDQSMMYYILGKKIGEGAYAVVHDTVDYFGQPYVMKIQKPERAKHVVEADWRKEMEFLLSVNHPNIIQLYDAFNFNNLYYYVLEKADGSLRDLVENHPQGKMTFSQVIEIAAQVLSGLCHIHKKNIIHRDLQIDNILFKQIGSYIFIKISDFGISKQLDAGDAAIGTTGRGWEVAPELLLYGRTTFQSDLYQLGLILYHLIAGKPVIDENNPAYAADIQAPVRNGVPSQLAASLSSPIASVLAKLLDPHLNKRYSTAYQVWNDLHACYTAHLSSAATLDSESKMTLSSKTKGGIFYKWKKRWADREGRKQDKSKAASKDKKDKTLHSSANHLPHISAPSENTSNSIQPPGRTSSPVLITNVPAHSGPSLSPPGSGQSWKVTNNSRMGSSPTNIRLSPSRLNASCGE